MRELLEEFIERAKDNSPDALYIYEETDEAIETFLAQRED